MKRLVLAFMAFALLVGVDADISAAADIKELNITYVKSPLNIPSIVQKRMELFEKEFGPAGIAVGHPEITAGSKQTQAMAAGSVDFANCVGGTSVIIAASQGLDIKIVGIYGRSPKAFTLLVDDPAVKSLADLKALAVYRPTLPLTLTLRFRNWENVNACAVVPHVRRLDAQTIEVQAVDAIEAQKYFVTLHRLARS